MTMMITKFNKLISNPFVWVVFIGLVVFAFILMDSEIGKRNSNIKSPKDIMGKIFEQEITREEITWSYYSTILDYALQGSQFNIEDEMAIWRRLALLKKAEDMGFDATNEEVTQRIQDIVMSITGTNQFVYDSYNDFIINILPRFGMDDKGFEMFIRDSIIIEKAVLEVTLDTWVEEEEILSIFHDYNDLFVTEFTIISPSNYTTNNISEDQVKDFYNNNKDLFMIPEKITVDYVEFPIVNYTNNIDITENEILQVYSNTMERFRIDSESDTPKYMPIEDVKESLKTTILSYHSRQKAINKADEFVASLSEKGSDFELQAERFNLNVHNLPSFSINEDLDGIDDDFKKTAFKLELTETDYYSDFFESDEIVYVIALKDRFPAFYPEFDNVMKEVSIAAQANANQVFYFQQTEDIRADIQQRLDNGEDFKSILKNKSLEYNITDAYNLSSVLLDNNYANEIVSCTFSKDQNSLCSINTLDGFLIAYVQNRKVADTSILSEQRQLITDQLSQQKQIDAIQSWQETIIQEANIEIYDN